MVSWIRSGAVAVIVVAGVAGCGATRIQQPDAASSTDSASVATAPVAAVSTVDVVPSLPPTSTTQPGGKDFEVVSEFGRVDGRVPVDAGPDPLEASYGQPPDFVVGVQRWVVADCCRLSVVLQNVRPLFPDSELMSTINSGGLFWNVYDAGPGDGTQIAAITSIGDLSISVGGQTLFPDQPTQRTTADVIVAVVATITASDVTGAQ